MKKLQIQHKKKNNEDIAEIYEPQEAILLNVKYASG